MVAGIAERELVPLRALEPEMKVVLPREADAAMHLHGAFAERAKMSHSEAFAIDAARVASRGSASWACAAYHRSERAGSTSATISAAMCLIAWKEPIGRPNCSRVFE